MYLRTEQFLKYIKVTGINGSILKLYVEVMDMRVERTQGESVRV